MAARLDRETFALLQWYISHPSWLPEARDCSSSAERGGGGKAPHGLAGGRGGQDRRGRGDETGGGGGEVAGDRGGEGAGDGASQLASCSGVQGDGVAATAAGRGPSSGRLLVGEAEGAAGADGLGGGGEGRLPGGVGVGGVGGVKEAPPPPPRAGQTRTA